ncbi:nitric oxide dioxygenase [Parastagonospora nodorum]|nr:nitric oxide dioxygenase [Parastagonospora nodorum]
MVRMSCNIYTATLPRKFIINPNYINKKRYEHTSTSLNLCTTNTSKMALLSPSQVQIIKSTVPVLAQHGEAITAKFYTDLLTANPSLKNVFNTTHQATGHQSRALAGALYAYAANIDNLGALSPALELICHKHVSLFIQPAQYAIVGEFLLATMKTVLGAAATWEVLDAWGAAYWQLADIMIAKEEGLYKSTPGWDGWKDFTIVRKVAESGSGEICSFYLKPKEAGVEVPVFKPGQYVSVNVRVEELDGGVWQARQYSLSDASGKGYLRISVKKEMGEAREGYVSNILHGKSEGDVVRVSHPFGDFFFDREESGENGPVVLISAGVGLTCLTSILNGLAAEQGSRPVSWIHGARDLNARAFKKDVDTLVAANRNIRAVYFSSNPKEGEVEGQDYHIKGRVDMDKVGKDALFADNDQTQYFICGPTQFMLDVQAKLKSYGVPAERIKMELFGTGGVPRV